MAQVTVAYEDLSASADSLKNIGTYVQEVHNEINDLVSAFEPLSAKHNNCFGDVINALDDLEHAFRNYYSEVAFLAEQCTNAVNAFKDAEGDSIELSETIKKVFSILDELSSLRITLRERDVTYISSLINLMDQADIVDFYKNRKEVIKNFSGKSLYPKTILLSSNLP